MSDYETFNRQAQMTMRYPTIDRDELTRIFLDIESLVYYGIHAVLQVSSFAEDNLCYLLAEIACGSIKSRKVYRGRRSLRKVDAGEEIEVGANNLRIFGIGFDLFKLSKCDRETAVPLVKKVLRALRLSTSIYENILIAFLAEVDRYCALRDELAALTLRIRQERGRQPLVADMKRISDLIDEVSLVEMNVGCVRPNELYGVCRIVRETIAKIRRHQERILKAYMRLIPGPARKVASSEIEALDFFQFGCLGLAHAISRYNARKGASFPTYAQTWIRQRIFDNLKRSSPIIRLPNSILENWQKIRSAERSLAAKAETREYTDEDLAEATGLSLKTLNMIRRKMEETKVVPLASLTPEGETEYETLGIAETQTDEEEELRDMRSSIASILDRVGSDQRRIICLKYGYLEGILNEAINPHEALRERLRQLAWSARVIRVRVQQQRQKIAESSVPLPD